MPIEDLKVKPEILSPKPPSIATDEEFASGTSTTASPTVKQAKENLVTIDTKQTISGSKRFTQPPEGMSIELTADTNQQTVPATAAVRQLGLYRNATYTKGDGYTCWLQGYRGSDGHTASALYTRRFLESDSQEIISYIQVTVTVDGIPVSYTKTPPIGVSNEEIVTAGWFNSKMQVVSALPANPDPNVFYFIPE
jgi:hypothetical protein